MWTLNTENRIRGSPESLCYASSESESSEEEMTKRLVPLECQKPPQHEGNSNRTHLMWFYNETAARCQKYAADLPLGQEIPKPAKNSFLTLAECNKKCRDPHYGTCGGPKNDTICTRKGKEPELERRFWFDPDNRTCRPYYYGGCDPNSNTYRTKGECLSDCAEFIEDRCAVPIDEGECYDSEVRYGYNPIYQDCERFNYTGCGGNRNNFRVAKDCWFTCATTEGQREAS
ncbi:tissue factor pathway inhibitor 2-like [Rhipicephalus sanguineus]|uniref:tissue factor pathway inhibitor 2-like n=1 Tax=Rhipicephalus sanguineus TaxID=34632 RepID=UPI0020C294A4|nr:tissue factor pathway inhibitor 2-like [Rhipicephalus sanguineus]